MPREEDVEQEGKIADLPRREKMPAKDPIPGYLAEAVEPANDQLESDTSTKLREASDDTVDYINQALKKAIAEFKEARRVQDQLKQYVPNMQDQQFLKTGLIGTIKPEELKPAKPISHICLCKCPDCCP